MPGLRRSKRRSGRRVVSSSRPHISGRSKAATVGRTFRRSKRRQQVSLATKAKSAKRLRSAVVANAKALDAVKNREFGYWQTTNSVIDGATPSEHMGNSYNHLSTDKPVLIHLNNLHSCNGTLPVDPNTSSPSLPVPHDEQQGACHLLAAQNEGLVSKDGLVRSFVQVGTFAVNGVLQKPKRTGPHMYPRVGYPNQDPLRNPDTPLIPIPNGKKVRWGGVDLQFRIEGALQDTQFDFYIVKSKKEKDLSWDPWHQTIPDTARSVPGVLPYTINDFQHLHHPMYPKSLDPKRYTILDHRRVLVNNVHRITGQTGHVHLLPDNAKYATGNTWSHTKDLTGPYAGIPTHLANTPAVQHLRMSYKPNSIVRPLRNFIGERIDKPNEQRGSFADANPTEKATLGTMSWDNFHPNANVWLVMTTNHQRISTHPIFGPYSHKGFTNWTTLATAQQYEWDGETIKREPEHYTAWRTSAGAHVGSDSRELQLQSQFAALGPTATDWIPNQGKFWLEYDALLRERKARDDYRNPRIHIFRRTWWQDEHIPTALSEQFALSRSEAEIQTTPITPSAPTPATPAVVRDVEQRFHRARMGINRARTDPRMAGIDTTSTDPNTWTAYLAGHALHVAGAAIPQEYLDMIQDLRSLTGLCDLYGINRYTYVLLQRMALMAQPPTPDQPMDPLAKRKRDHPDAMEPSGDPMMQTPPSG